MILQSVTGCHCIIELLKLRQDNKYIQHSKDMRTINSKLLFCEQFLLNVLQYNSTGYIIDSHIIERTDGSRILKQLLDSELSEN